MLDESLRMLHMVFVSLMRSLSNFMIFGIGRGQYKDIFNAKTNDFESLYYVLVRWMIVIRLRNHKLLHPY